MSCLTQSNDRSCLTQSVDICVTLLMMFLLCIQSIGVETLTVERNITELSKLEAEEFCKLNGGILASYSDIKYRSSTLEHLNDTESAWLSDFAAFSPFLISYGCFKTVDFGHVTVLNDMSLFSCVEYCQSLGQRGRRTVGISQHICYCFSIPYYEFSPVEISFCDAYCSNYTLERCGGKNVMSIYSFDWDFKADWGYNEPSPKQCVYVSHTDWKVHLYTSSCYITDESSDTIDGYLCMTWWSDKIVFNCSAQAGGGAVCLIENSTSWQQANDACLTGKGYMSHFWSSGLQTMIRNNKNYWLGRYRTFNPTQTENGNVCLVITRHGESFFMETEDCSANKTAFCIEQIEATLKTETSTFDTNLDNIFSNLNDSLSKKSKLENFGLKAFWMTILAISAAGILLLFILGGVMYFLHPLCVGCFTDQSRLRFKAHQDYYLHPRSDLPQVNLEPRDARVYYEHYYSDVFLQARDQSQQNYETPQSKTGASKSNLEGLQQNDEELESNLVVPQPNLENFQPNNEEFQSKREVPPPCNKELFYHVTQI